MSETVRPRRPEPNARVGVLEAVPPAGAFIAGNGIAASCRYVLNYDELSVNDEVENDWWFCKADYLEYFFRKHAPREPFVLFSHNSDRSIGPRFRSQLRRRRLIAWLAVNPVVEHPKLRALPIGIANPRWPHGDQRVLERVAESAAKKDALFDVSFSLDTNPGERSYCLEQTRLALAPRRAFPEYLERLASAYFCISPRGNGVDSHRTWEALSVGTIPVVTRSLVTEHHSDFPMIVLDDWSEFRSIEFTPDLYVRVWGEWDAEALRLERYMERVRADVERLRRS